MASKKVPAKKPVKVQAPSAQSSLPDKHRPERDDPLVVTMSGIDPQWVNTIQVFGWQPGDSIFTMIEDYFYDRLSVQDRSTHGDSLSMKEFHDLLAKTLGSIAEGILQEVNRRFTSKASELESGDIRVDVSVTTGELTVRVKETDAMVDVRFRKFHKERDSIEKKKTKKLLDAKRALLEAFTEQGLKDFLQQPFPTEDPNLNKEKSKKR